MLCMSFILRLCSPSMHAYSERYWDKPNHSLQNLSLSEYSTLDTFAG